jgi:hypothetical protein
MSMHSQAVLDLLVVTTIALTAAMRLQVLLASAPLQSCCTTSSACMSQRM